MVPLNNFPHNQAKKKLPIYLEKEEGTNVGVDQNEVALAG